MITALILAGALIAALIFAPYPGRQCCLPAGCRRWLGKWAALVGARCTFQGRPYAASSLLLCGALWMGLALDGPSGTACSALAGRCRAPVVCHAGGAQVLLRWPRRVGLRVGARGHGVADAHATWLAVTVCLTLINGPFVVFLLILTFRGS
ncbi:MAG: hypothetical protein CM15mP92_1840 [Halieaceae bacterium]|nr:MAG: hypothetical protein CM15mP92_1840 [Halieaceae bacterium]